MIYFYYMRQIACLVFNPTMDDGYEYVLLFSCTTVSPVSADLYIFTTGRCPTIVFGLASRGLASRSLTLTISVI